MACSCGHCSTTDSNPGAQRQAEGSGRRARLAVHLLALRFVLASALFFAGLLAPILLGSLPWYSGSALFPALSRAAFILSWLVAGYRVVINSIRNILKGDVFDENFLMTVATVGAFIIGQWSEGAAVMLFYNLGEMIQESAVNRSRRSITDLMDVRPDSARLERDGTIVHPSSVAEGTLIRVAPGEKVPLDGMIVEGSSTFDTSRLTGESVPRDALTGGKALAGFVNGAGLLLIRTTSLYADTAASKMLELIENAQNRKAHAEKLITRFARIYTPIVTVGAVLLALVPPIAQSLALSFSSAQAPLGGIAFPEWEAFRPWVSRALVFLVISCPCAFVISVPLGFFGGIGGAAKRGILVKGADYIDVLARAKAVVFDKTGTLTKGVFTVQGVEAAEGFTRDGVLALAAIAEHHSNHPAAIAIRAFAGLQSHAESPFTSVDSGMIRDYSERAGYGISLVYGETEVLAGSRRHMEDRLVVDLPSVQDGSGTSVEIASGGRYAGRIILDDEPKEDSSLAVSMLRSLGVDSVAMLTGDCESSARSMAARMGITEYSAGVLPHEKVSLFEEIAEATRRRHPAGSVLFVGDGINDAAVLARADVGIAMGGMGSDAAIEAADVVLMTDKPSLVAEAIRSARWTRHIVAENIALSFAIKIGFLALGALGIATLWEAVFADVGVALLATVNSLRARR